MKQAQILNYEIDSEIGRGGMATVYKAKHIKLGNFVAIKTLNPALAADEVIRERFTQEAKILASLDHKGITRINDFDESENHLAIVMEYLQGQTLNEYINEKGALSSNEAKEIFLKILDAFDYAHKNGIVHRDIKPSNIFITNEGDVKIMDFGIAKLKEEGAKLLTQTGTQMGTPVYMSPEQINDSKHINHLSDIYSLGVCLWMMLTGKTPYDAKTDSMFAIYKKIDSKLLDELKDAELNAIVQKATFKNKDNRYKNCKDFANAIKNGVTEQKDEITIIENDNIIKDEITIIENDNEMSNKPAEWFNTEERRTQWWNQLEDQWKRTFNLFWFGSATVSKLDDQIISKLFNDTPKFILIGSKGEIGDDNKKEGWQTIPFELPNLQGIENFTNLTELKIQYNKLTCLKGIENLTSLTDLNIDNNKLTCLKGIENLSKLEFLHISGNKLQSLDGIENLSKLELLYCDDNKIKSLIGIENLTNLTDLDISENSISSLIGIENLTNLTDLDISENSISSLNGIENLTNLTDLDISENKITRLNGIENLANLGWLNFCENYINSVNPLEIVLNNHNTNKMRIWYDCNPLRVVKREFWKRDLNEVEYLKKKYPWFEF